MNSSDKKIKTKKDSYNKNSVNDLLQRIASGQSGVVLEVLF
jgi:3-methyladenine DNA glycosylase AlkC